MFLINVIIVLSMCKGICTSIDFFFPKLLTRKRLLVFVFGVNPEHQNRGHWSQILKITSSLIDNDKALALGNDLKYSVLQLTRGTR